MKQWLKGWGLVVGAISVIIALLLAVALELGDFNSTLGITGLAVVGSLAIGVEIIGLRRLPGKQGSNGK